MIKKSKTIKKPIADKKPVGSPSKYRVEYCQIVKALASKGYIEEEMYGIIGVSKPTFGKWKRDYPEFLTALKAGKQAPDDRVEKALYEAALGGEYKAQKPMAVSDGQGLGSHVEVIEYTERIPSNVVAQIFWLKNRRPDKWREKQDIEHSGSIGYRVIPDEELEADGKPSE